MVAVLAAKMAAAEVPNFASLLATAAGLSLRDQEGQEVPFRSIYKEKKAIIVFVREADVRLAVVGCAPHKYIKGFKELTGFTGDVFADSERVVYQALGLKYTLSSQGAGAHVKSSLLGGVLKSTWRTIKNAGMQGDVKQQGGAFIISTDGNVTFGHQDAGSQDHVPINDLLAKVGMEPVDFKPAK